MGKDTLPNLTPKVTKITRKMGVDTVMRGGGWNTLSNVTPKTTKLTGKMDEERVMGKGEYIVKCDTKDKNDGG